MASDGRSATWGGRRRHAGRLRAFKEVGFTGMLMPDHSSQVIGDTDYGHRGRAFAMGHIKALMKAVRYQ